MDNFLNNLPITLDDCKEAFEQDGALRDIYVHGTTMDDWQKFINFISDGGYKFSFSTGSISLPLPNDVQQIFSQQECSLLSISINGATVNSHFFCTEEIELDINPMEIIHEENFRDLMKFVSDLGQATMKEVKITHENSPNILLFLYVPQKDQVKYFSYR